MIGFHKLNMSLKLLCASFLLTCVTAECPKLCRCPESVDNLVFEMHCNNATLTEVPSGDFQDVFFLDLSFNNISTLKNSTFVENNIKKLVRLYLNNNGLITIEKYALRGLTELKLLNLEQNSVITLYSNIFEDNRKLEVLNLNGNPNLNLPDNGFVLPNLDILLLKHCGLKNIPTYFFKNMLNLQHIFLQGNELSIFDPQLILPLSNLKQLDLRGNQFTLLPIGLGLSETMPKELVVNFEGNPLACDCKLESAYTLNKEKKLYDILTCGTPAASTLHKFLLDKCTNNHLAYQVAITTFVSSTPPVTSPSTTTYTPSSIASTEDGHNQAILPQDRDLLDWVSTDESDLPSDYLTSLNMWWIILSAVFVAILIIAIIVALIKKHKRGRHYTMPRRFTALDYEDEEQNFIT